MINIRFFALLREQVDCDSLQIDAQQSQTVADLRQRLIDQGAPWLALEQQQILVAVNHTLCGLDTPIQDGDEVAFFPPVTGG